MEAYDEPGKLRKQCSACNKYVHVKSRVCVCGQEFPKTEKKTEPAEPTPLPSKTLRRVATPAGDCPLKLTGTDSDTVDNWAQRLIIHGQKEGLDFTTKALKYFVRHIYEYGSDNHYKVCCILDDLNPGKDRHVDLTPIKQHKRQIDAEDREFLDRHAAKVSGTKVSGAAVKAENQISRPVQASDEEIVM